MTEQLIGGILALVLGLIPAGALSPPRVSAPPPLASLAVVGAVTSPSGVKSDASPRPEECKKGHFYKVEVDTETAKVTIRDLGIDPSDDPVNPRLQGKVFFQISGISGRRGFIEVPCDSSVDASKWKVLSEAAKTEALYGEEVNAQVEAMTPERQLTLTEILALNKQPTTPSTAIPSTGDLFELPKETPVEGPSSPSTLEQLQRLWGEPGPAESSGLSLLEQFDREKANRPPTLCAGEDIATCLQSKRLESEQWRADFQRSAQDSSARFSSPSETFAGGSVPLPRPRPSGIDAFLADPVGSVKSYVEDVYEGVSGYLRGSSPKPADDVLTAAQEPSFNDRAGDAFSQDWTVSDAATAELLQKKGIERLVERESDTSLGTRESPLIMPPSLPPTPDPGQGSAFPPEDERPVPYVGPLPLGMSLSADGRLLITRDPEAQSSREFDAYKNDERLLDEARQYAGTNYPIIVDFGDKVVVLSGEKYGLEDGAAVVRGNNLGNFNFGWDTNVAEKAEGTLRNGFEGSGDDGVAARRFLGNVNLETDRTVAQDIAQEIGRVESEKSLWERAWESSSIYPPTVTVDGLVRSGDSVKSFSVQDLVGPYEKDQPSPTREIVVELIPAPSTPEESLTTPQVISETPAAPLAPPEPTEVAPTPTEPSTAEPSPESIPETLPLAAPLPVPGEPAPPLNPLPAPIIVEKLDVAEVLPVIPDTPGESFEQCQNSFLCTDTPVPPSLPTPDVASPDVIPTVGRPTSEQEILETLNKPLESTPETPVERETIDKLKVPGAAPSVADREQVAEIIKGKPQMDLEVTFDFNSAVVGDKAKLALTNLGNVLSREEFKEKTIFINGYTDAVGSAGYNLELSQRRADAIRQYLIETSGLTPAQLIAVGFGKEQLKFPGDPRAAENRRVQIAVTQ